MAKRGRPSKLPNIDLRQVEACGAMGCTIEEVALLFDVAPRTIQSWKKNQEFLLALKRGQAKADNQVEQRLYKKALDGDTT
ncbi:MAG: helix-turn-helix domain-containing protein, partial [Bacilli bacterium]